MALLVACNIGPFAAAPIRARPLAQLNGHTKRVNHITFFPEAAAKAASYHPNSFVSASDDASAIVFDASKDWAKMATLPMSGPVHSAAVAPGCAHLVTIADTAK
eukprot:gene5912-5810_t